MVTGLLLIVAVLAFAGLAYQTVPMIVPETKTETFIRFQTGPQPTQVVSTYIGPIGTTWEPGQWIIEYNTAGGTTYEEDILCNGGYSGYEPCSLTWEVTYTNVMLSTPTIAYSYTATSFVPVSSTSLVPASVALGLTDVSFTALVVVVIGILALLTEWVTLKSRESTHRAKQATPAHFVNASTSCIKCGAELPPASDFCNKCGTKQTV